MSLIENTSELDVETCDEEIATVKSNTVEVDIVELGIQKSASCSWTVPGGEITFCNVITNTSETDLEEVVFRDVLDPRFTYVEDSFEVDEQPQTPSISNNTIEYMIDELNGGASITICFKVRATSV